MDTGAAPVHVPALGGPGTLGPDPGDADNLAPFATAHVLAGFASDGGPDAPRLRAAESRPLEAATVDLAVASVGAGAELVLRWPRVGNLPTGWAAVLADTQTGARVDLAEASEYAFAVVPQTARVAALAPEAAEALAVPAWFTLPAAGAARLSVVDLLGREVAVLVDGALPSGGQVATVDTSALAPGVDVVRLAAGTEVLTRRLVVVRKCGGPSAVASCAARRRRKLVQSQRTAVSSPPLSVPPCVYGSPSSCSPSPWAAATPRRAWPPRP